MYRIYKRFGVSKAEIQPEKQNPGSPFLYYKFSVKKGIKCELYKRIR